MEECKIVIDTCVIIAASINHSCSKIPGDITEKCYPTSKSLLEHIKKNNIKGVDILQISIDKAKNKFSEIIYRNIERISKYNKLDLKSMLDEHALALLKINSCLRENLSGLNIIPYMDNNLIKIKQKVRKFYQNLPLIIKEHHPINSVKRMIKNTPYGYLMKKEFKKDEKNNFKIINKLLNKLGNSNIDDEDATLLAYSNYLWENSKENETNVFLVSIDQHFCSIELNGDLNNIIPELIETRFHVKCKRPEQMLKELLKNNHSHLQHFT